MAESSYSFLFLFFFLLNLFIWLCRVLAAVGGLLSCGTWTLSCGMHVGSSSLTRGQTRAPCIGSTESYSLCHRESPSYSLFFFFFFKHYFIYLWLCWVFVSVRGLSLVVASGGHSSSRCTGPLIIAASLVAEHRLQMRRLSNCGSRA